MRLALLLWLLSLATPVLAGEAERARGVRVTAAAVGAATGLGLGLAMVDAATLHAPGVTPGERVALVVPTLTVQTAASTWATWWFADRCLHRHKGPWRSIGWGVLYGSAAGAASFGSGLATFVTLGQVTGTLDSGSRDTWWKAGGAGLWGGSVLGGLYCIPVGALLAPAISLTMRW
jgi:hypothetical protein